MSRALLLLCLLGFAAASKQRAAKHQADDSGDGSDVSADASDASGAEQSDNNYGYEAPASSNVAYATPTVHYAHVEVKASAVCYTGQCSRHARCFNRATGTCSPRACAGRVVMHAASYAQEDAGYAQEDAGYAVDDGDAKQDSGYRHRRLQQQQYGGQQQQYNGGAVAYGGDFRGDYGGDEGYPYPINNNNRCGCPPGTEDTWGWSMHGQTVLWVGFGFLFLPALCFLWKSFEDIVSQNSGGAATPGLIAGVTAKDVTEVRLNAGVVNLVASLAYLAMATKHGFTTRCNGRDFYYARYVDWIITTPLMLWDLCILAGTDKQSRWFLVCLDVFMIVAGLIGSLVDGSAAGFGSNNEKWGFFGMAMLGFIPIIWFLCRMTGNPSTSGQFLSNTFSCISCAPGNSPRERAYQRTMNITVVSWICYPIIWIVAEGTSNLSVNGENIAYTVLDIIAKSVFGWILVFSNWHLTAAASNALTASSAL